MSIAGKFQGLMRNDPFVRPDTRHVTNIAKLPKEQRAQLEEDKQRWFLARELVIKHDRGEVLNWLNSLGDHDKKDMRRRLNKVTENRR